MNQRIFIAGICLLVILIGGVIGGVLANSKDADCTLGVGSYLCWKWKSPFLSPNGKIDREVRELLNSQE